MLYIFKLYECLLLLKLECDFERNNRFIGNIVYFSRNSYNLLEKCRLF